MAEGIAVVSHAHAVKVMGIHWLGIRADRYDGMVGFLRDVLGLDVVFEEEGTTELSLPDGNRVQVFGPGNRYHRLFGEQASGPVPLFEVDDLDEARQTLEAAGIELLGDAEQDIALEWLNFRAPDGNVYELARQL
jgi:catechol 2,3-dioxygenase-like lactoylglutathione lyase family enzyme